MASVIVSGGLYRYCRYFIFSCTRYTRTKECYDTAAVMVRTSAFNNLARLHDLQLVDDADSATAERLYMVATKLGNAHAPYHLAEMLEAAGATGDTALRQRIDSLRDLAAERGFAGPGKGPEPAH